MLRWRHVGLALVFAAIVASLPLAFSLPDEAVEIIERQIETLANRSIEITGDTRIKVFPEPRIILEGLVLDSGEANKAPLLTVRRVTAYPRLLQILFGSFEVRRFELEAPIIHLAVDTNGRLNWSTYDAEDFDALSIQNPYIGEVTISDGMLEFKNRGAAEPLIISDIEGALNFPRFLAEAQLNASAIAQDRAFSLDIAMTDPVNLLFGGVTDMTVRLDSEDSDLMASGRLRTGLAAGFVGSLALLTKDLPALVNWIGIETEPRLLPRDVTLDSQVAITRALVNVSSASMTLDGQRAEGELTFGLSKSDPPVEGTLAFESLSLDRIFAQMSGVQTSPTAAGIAQSANAEPAESDENATVISPDVGAPQLFWLPAIPLEQSIDLRVSADALSMAGVTALDVAITLTVSDGRADIGLGGAVIAGGQVAGAGLVEMGDEKTSATFNMSMQELMLDEVFGPLSATGWVGGRMSADISLHLPDTGSPEMWTGLEGSVILKMSDGSFRLPKSVRLISPGLPGVIGTIAEKSLRRRSRGVPMDHGALEITFKAGGANITRLELSGPRGQLTGNGRVALNNGAMSFQIDASDGDSDQTPAIPIAVSGSLTSPVASGDLAALARLFAN